MQVSKKFIDSILSSLEETVRKSSSAIMEIYASNKLNKQDKKDGIKVSHTKPLAATMFYSRFREKFTRTEGHEMCFT